MPRLAVMPEPTVIPPGGGEVIGDSPARRVEILCDRDELHATWSRFGPGRDGADLHIHRAHTDFFYVLAGALTVKLGGGEEVAVPAGKLVRVPPFVAHGFRNGGDAELRYLNLHAPGAGFAGYMRGIRDGRRIDFDQDDPPADGLRPATDAVIGEPFADAEELAIALVDGDSEPRGGERAVLAYYVLEGELAIVTSGREQRAPAGSWINVPAGAEHTVSASGRYLDLRS
jgi:mannose-6-phosphate isomerase-like protein (cupin superfamily)